MENTIELKNRICQDYLVGFSIADICIKHKRTDKTVRAILIENNITLRDAQGKDEDGKCVSVNKQNTYPQHEGFTYVAIAKDNPNIKYNDYLNKSGVLTNYIKNELGVDVPSVYLRKKYKIENGIQWHEQYFDIVEEAIVEVPTKKCPYCDWETTDVENKSGALGKHLLEKHNMKVRDYLKDYPEDKEYFEVANISLNRRRFVVNPDEYIECAICGERLSRIDWRHLQKHNITLQEYKAKYGNTTISKELYGKLFKCAEKANMNMQPKFISKPEMEIGEFLEANGIEIERANRKMLGGMELDIYIPSKKLAIEYNGLYWHQEGMNNKDSQSHLNKLEKCKEKGIRLLQIFEDEYHQKNDAVYDKIGKFVGIYRYENIHTNDYTIKEVSEEEIKEYINKHSLVEVKDATLNIVCLRKENIIGVLSLKDINDGEWIINGLEAENPYLEVEMLNYFKDNYNTNVINVLLDRRFGIDENDNVYLKCGFVFDGYMEPEFMYYNKAIDKLNRFNEEYLVKNNLNEDEFTKIWDCGYVKYVWKKKNN